MYVAGASCRTTIAHLTTYTFVVCLHTPSSVCYCVALERNDCADGCVRWVCVKGDSDCASCCYDWRQHCAAMAAIANTNPQQPTNQRSHAPVASTLERRGAGAVMELRVIRRATARPQLICLLVWLVYCYCFHSISPFCYRFSDYRCRHRGNTHYRCYISVIVGQTVRRTTTVNMCNAIDNTCDLGIRYVFHVSIFNPCFLAVVLISQVLILIVICVSLCFFWFDNAVF